MSIAHISQHIFFAGWELPNTGQEMMYVIFTDSDNNETGTWSAAIAYVLGSYQANVSTELTILTGFIDIGVIDVPGTDNTDHKDPEHYLYWMEMYSVIQNPVVFFTDQDYIADGMLEIRGDLPTLVNKPWFNSALDTITWYQTYQ